METRYRHLFKDFDFPVSESVVPGDLLVAFDGQGGRDLSIEASKAGTWTLKLTPEFNLKAGDTIAFARELPSRGFEGYRLALRPQNHNPKGLDYVTAECAQARLEVTANRFNVKGREIALVTIEQGNVLAGTTITLNVGDKSCGGLGSFNWPVAKMDCMLLAYYRTAGVDSSFSPFSTKVHLSTQPAREPRRLQVVAPSDVVCGEPFILRVAVRDLNGNLLERFNGPIEAEVVGGPSSSSSAWESSDSVSRIPIEVSGEGVRWVRVKAAGLVRLSNPFLVHQEEPPLKTYWGDIHAHCYDASEIKVLDEISHPRSVMLTGRDENLIDVCAASPHFFHYDSDAMDCWWEILNESCRELNDPGTFVTFPCLEYRGQGGDRNLLFLNEQKNPPYLDQTLEPIWALSPSKVSVLPHVGGGTSDWTLHRPILEPSAEVASAHGNFEWFLQAGLSRGAEVGVHASSDGHNRTAGHPRHVQMGGGRYGDLNRRDCSYGGASVAAFNAAGLDRQDIWNALRSRNTYGCTDARMLMSFEINGRRMGSVLEADAPPSIRAWAAGTSPIQRLEVVRDDRLLHAQACGEHVGSSRFMDDSLQPGKHYYYLRVTQSDGEIGWSSPIWVSYHRRARTSRKLPRWNRQELLHRRTPTREALSERSRLEAYLKREEEDRFYALRWTHMADSPQGRLQYFAGYDRRYDEPIHVKWYTDFPDERLRIDPGWRDYGQYPRNR